ncbi:MAG: hypothetical protein ACRC6E_06470 [Fusobacteriaceae bacterium]
MIESEKKVQFDIEDTNEIQNLEEKQDFVSEENYFNTFSEEKQLELEEEVYRDYIKQCGQETKIQKIAFKAAKKNLIFKYILNNDLIQSSCNPTTESQKIEDIKLPQEDEVDVLNNIKAFNDYINGTIEMYKLGFDLTSDEASRIKKEIFLELTNKFMLRKLTIEELNETIKRKLN